MEKVIKKLQTAQKVLILSTVISVALLGIFLADRLTCMTVHGDGISCEKIGFITREERYRDESGGLQNIHEFTDIQNGDILISLSTHTLGWRHGHAAIVVDAERGITLEAALWGQPSSTMRLRHWSSYANSLHFRVRESVAEEALFACGIKRDETVTAATQLGGLAAAFAEKYENEVMYGLLTGLGDKSPSPESISKTQCAHLVWYAYEHYGVDLDSDGGWLVTPKDIALSDQLAVIDEFGNPLGDAREDLDR